MGIKVKEEWRFRRIKSETASKSAFAFKINNKHKSKHITTPYSKEVVVKITGGARSKGGIKRAVKYISRDWSEEIMDCNGIRYRTEDEMKDAVKILQGNVITSIRQRAKEEKLTHNMMFSAPRMAGVKREHALEATRKAITEKYPDNYFVMGYHEETKNHHVHVVLNINKYTGEKIDIKKQDLRHIRESYCKTLVDYGYDVKVTHKYAHGIKDYRELISKENRNTYQIVDFGSAAYKLDKRNSKSNYITYKTSNNKEVTIWGREVVDEIMNKNIKIGDTVTIKKTGSIDIKVPVYDKDGETVIDWKVTKRNRWSVEKVSNESIKIKVKQGDSANDRDNGFINSKSINLKQTHSNEQEYKEEIRLDNQEQAVKQLRQKQKFDHEKKLLLDAEYRKNFQLKQKLEYKHKQDLRY